jgi:glucokinase
MTVIDDQESEVLARLRVRFCHVSSERVLSGQGLMNLYHALAEIAGVMVDPIRRTNFGSRHR